MPKLVTSLTKNVENKLVSESAPDVFTAARKENIIQWQRARRVDLPCAKMIMKCP